MTTLNDKQVLNAILNPNTPFEEEEETYPKNKTKYETSPEIEEAKKDELEGIKMAENNDLNLSIEYFNLAVSKAPNWASSYNNRAQALRLSGEINGPSNKVQQNQVEELETIESLNDKHKKLRKELQSKIQSLKKSVTKGDKKKKKEVDAQVDLLEKEFEEKCAIEIKELEKKILESNHIDKEDHTTNKPILETVTNQIDEDLREKSISSNKLTKSKKRKEKKEKELENREKLIALQEIENKKGPAFIELTKIKDKLKKRDLEIKDVISDGNCMYYAISDQLLQHLEVNKNIHELRRLTSDYMLHNPDEFQPYLCSEDTGDPLNQDEYADYCNKVKDTTVWGGHLELKALSDILKVVIEVIQAESSDIIIGDINKKHENNLVITYHRHMFGSGEHYNSTSTASKNIDEQQID